VLTVSTLYPVSTQKTLNVVEFYYPEEIAAFEPEFARPSGRLHGDLHRGRRDRRAHGPGRKALFERGDDEVGPYQSPMEDGMQHFHEWYRRVMGMGRASW
jgi:hypothetical protein